MSKPITAPHTPITVDDVIHTANLAWLRYERMSQVEYHAIVLFAPGTVCKELRELTDAAYRNWREVQRAEMAWMRNE